MLTKIFAQLGIINWKTTMTGITSLVAALGVILNAWRTKDFGTIFTQSQTLIPVIMLILTGLGLLSAKDSTVTGVGSQAATLTDNNKLLTVEGDVVKNPAPGASN